MTRKSKLKIKIVNELRGVGLHFYRTENDKIQYPYLTHNIEDLETNTLKSQSYSDITINIELVCKGDEEQSRVNEFEGLIIDTISKIKDSDIKFVKFTDIQEFNEIDNTGEIQRRVIPCNFLVN